jgi:dTDP-4-dehydrorhamnose reductase
MKIYVLGSNGMLGNYVTKYLKMNFNVVALTRKDIEIKIYNEFEFNKIILNLGIKSNDVIINCIGLIKQRTKTTENEFLIVNSLFPQMLSKICKKQNIKFIHVTTDCVFNGNEGNYSENDLHNDNDIYGVSKSYGEPSNCTVIRTSIIGEEKYNKLSLIEWVKSNKNKTINGYSNHLWNGITCLEFAKLCEYIIKTNDYWLGVKHIYSPNSLSKFDLLKIISKIYNLNITVNSITMLNKCDRTLSTIYKKSYIISTIEEQIKEQYMFLKNK